MKKAIYIFLVGVIFILSSCEKQDSGSDMNSYESNQLKNSPPSNSNKEKGHKWINFRTQLSGDQEVPANKSKATGQAIFNLSKDGTELQYKLITANIENVTQAHIHVAPAEVNGPVILWLYPSSPPFMLKPGKTNGILQQGTITSANLTGMLKGLELEDLLDLMIEGNTYVNIHTLQFPEGELRGQIWGYVPGE